MMHTFMIKYIQYIVSVRARKPNSFLNTVLCAIVKVLIIGG